MKGLILNKGFTLVELMIVLVLIVILFSLSYPSYLNYVRESRRTEAKNTLLAMQLAQEQYRFNHSQYGSLAQVWGTNNKTENGYYLLTINDLSPTGYTLTAAALGDQQKDTDGSKSCSSLTIKVTGLTTQRTPLECWN